MRQPFMTLLASLAVIVAISGVVSSPRTQAAPALAAVVASDTQDVALPIPEQDFLLREEAGSCTVEPDPQGPRQFPRGGLPDSEACKAEQCSADGKGEHNTKACKCPARQGKKDHCNKDGTRNSEGMEGCINGTHCKKGCCHCCPVD